MDEENTNLIKYMRPMEKHNYMSNNYKKCPHCNNSKKLLLFWVKESNIIMDVCRVCDKKLKDLEMVEIALKTAKLNNNLL